ncbi:hypothetical protein K503DRAFT_800796 [Rhizopogon vinicolor AM-OR11-026]|uniref:CoA-dependent acyltransferase n=1 Tax=Rhizopogon vinicolor AM-OR11-026 TaxID=1314800 RepID=A0A1B7MZK0_9AGAM|nr:hypothetical protein K503DRAFT_800796 [Rhizopogon vinicolor AM-OR11-026]
MTVSAEKYPQMATALFKAQVGTPLANSSPPMNPPHYPEPTWIRVTGPTSAIYTRPLLGSELFDDRTSVLFDGMTDACVGFIFRSTRTADEVKQRARNAFGRLRFTCPIIATNIVGDVSGPVPRSWAYSTLHNQSEFAIWLNDAFCTVQRGDHLDVSAFVQDISRCRLPYELHSRSPLWFRCYLLLGDNNTYGLYFHGPHAIMDGVPTLNAFALMFQWMANDTTESADNLPWGTEWLNLPLGPVNATGGPREDWGIAGVQLLKQLSDSQVAHSIPLTLRPSWISQGAVGKTFRLERIFNPSLTRRLVNKARMVGCTMSHLFEAAHCMVMLAHSHLPPTKWNAYHFSANSSAASLIPHLRLPYDAKTHFISSRTHLPIQIPMDEISSIISPRKQLLQIAQSLKQKSARFATHPCMPHVQAARAYQPDALSEEPDVVSSGTVNNVGSIERRLPLSWKGEHDTERPAIELESVLFSVRVTSLAPIIHLWTMKDCLHVQIQANDAWPQADLQDVLDDICCRACLILEDFPQNPPRSHPSDMWLDERSRL